MSRYLKRYASKDAIYHYFKPSRAMAAAGVKAVRLDAERLDEHLRELTVLGLAAVSGELAAARRAKQSELHRHALSLLRSAKRRAQQRELPMLLTTADIERMLESSEFRCEVTGIPFDMTDGKDLRRAPFRPSLDRKNPRVGYELGNVRLVCVIVNAALGEWGDPVFWRMVEAASEHRAQNRSATSMSNVGV